MPSIGGAGENFGGFFFGFLDIFVFGFCHRVRSPIR